MQNSSIWTLQRWQRRAYLQSIQLSNCMLRHFLTAGMPTLMPYWLHKPFLMHMLYKFGLCQSLTSGIKARATEPANVSVSRSSRKVIYCIINIVTSILPCCLLIIRVFMPTPYWLDNSFFMHIGSCVWFLSKLAIRYLSGSERGWININMQEIESEFLKCQLHYLFL